MSPRSWYKVEKWWRYALDHAEGLWASSSAYSTFRAHQLCPAQPPSVLRHLSGWDPCGLYIKYLHQFLSDCSRMWHTNRCVMYIPDCAFMEDEHNIQCYKWAHIMRKSMCSYIMASSYFLVANFENIALYWYYRYQQTPCECAGNWLKYSYNSSKEPILYNNVSKVCQKPLGAMQTDWYRDNDYWVIHDSGFHSIRLQGEEGSGSRQFEIWGGGVGHIYVCSGWNSMHHMSIESYTQWCSIGIFFMRMHSVMTE